VICVVKASIVALRLSLSADIRVVSAFISIISTLNSSFAFFLASILWQCRHTRLISPSTSFLMECSPHTTFTHILHLCGLLHGCLPNRTSHIAQYEVLRRGLALDACLASVESDNETVSSSEEASDQVGEVEQLLPACVIIFQHVREEKGRLILSGN
jgi:hypothetical protein